MKATAEEIRRKFDDDVERFSDLERGHEAAMDSPLAMELIAAAAAATTPGARRALDVGCGGGNYALKLLQKLPGLELTLLDLSGAMLKRARVRVTAAGAGAVETVQGDVRTISPAGRYDIIVASAVLHHLREEEEWRQVFRRLYQALEPGGSFWIYDLLAHDISAVEELMQQRHGDHLVALRDEAYREQVFTRIREDDTPRSLQFQLDLLRETGFSSIDVLHKNARFAAFGGVK
ncbi:MAG TPA: class I SAM-dependent methyltransferase [Geobacteraceae bacterium]